MNLLKQLAVGKSEDNNSQNSIKEETPKSGSQDLDSQ